MNRFLGGAALALLISLSLTGAVQAQPVSKLTSNLDKATIQAIWCSALLLEESYMFEEDSDEALDYEDRAYELGGKIDAHLLDEGMNEEEIDEVWALFDEAALDFAADDENAYYEALGMCEDNYDALLN